MSVPPPTDTSEKLPTMFSYTLVEDFIEDYNGKCNHATTRNYLTGTIRDIRVLYNCMTKVVTLFHESLPYSVPKTRKCFTMEHLKEDVDLIINALDNNLELYYDYSPPPK